MTRSFLNLLLYTFAVIGLITAYDWISTKKIINNSPALNAPNSSATTHSIDKLDDCNSQNSVDALANCRLSLTLTALPTNRIEDVKGARLVIPSSISTITIQNKKSTSKTNQPTPIINTQLIDVITTPNPVTSVSPAPKQSIITTSTSNPPSAVPTMPVNFSNTPIAPLPISPLPTPP